MTQQQKNIKICEARGWRLESGGIGTINVYEPGAKLPRRCSLNIENAIPNHFSDLNAMHEAEKVLTDEQYFKRSEILCDMLTKEHPEQQKYHDGKAMRLVMSATAAQRAEAFGRTLNLW